MIIDNVENVACYTGNSLFGYYKEVKQVVVVPNEGVVIVTTKDGTEVILVNMPCRIMK